MNSFYARSVFFVEDAERALQFYTERLGFSLDWAYKEDARTFVFQCSLFGFELILNEGSDRDLDFVRELGKSHGKLGEPVHRGHPLRCEIQYTADQLIEVQLFDGVSGGLLTELSVEHKGMLSDQERADAREFLQQAEVS